MDTIWGADDLAGWRRSGPQAILFAKVASAADIEALAARLERHSGGAARPDMGDDGNAPMGKS